MPEQKQAPKPSQSLAEERKAMENYLGNSMMNLAVKYTGSVSKGVALTKYVKSLSDKLSAGKLNTKQFEGELEKAINAAVPSDSKWKSFKWHLVFAVTPAFSEGSRWAAHRVVGKLEGDKEFSLLTEFKKRVEPQTK